jgi:hypothetical protein
MAMSNALARIDVTAPPPNEQLARFLLGDVEMRPIRQAA